jgi:hypothetical protein
LERRKKLTDEGRVKRAPARAKRTNIQDDEAEEISVTLEAEEVAWDDEGFAIQTPFRLRESDPLVTPSPIPSPPSLSTLSPRLYLQKDLRRQVERRTGIYGAHFRKSDWDVVRSQKDAQARAGVVEYASLALRKNPTLSIRRKGVGVKVIKAFMDKLTSLNTTVATSTA